MATYAMRSAERKARLERALERLIAVCREHRDVRGVFVFGSLGSGRVGPRSDLDVLVVRDTAIVGIERGADLAIAADIGVALDLVVVTPLEYRERLHETSFGRTILATARHVYAA